MSCAQVRHGQPQPLDHRVEDPPQLGKMGLLAQHVEESRDVPSLGNGRFLFDADQPPQGLVAARFAERGLDSSRAAGRSATARLPTAHGPGSRRGLGRGTGGASPRACASGMEARNSLMVARLGLSWRQSQANRGLVMAICMGTSLKWVGPQSTSQAIPAQGEVWSKNRGKPQPGGRIPRKDGLTAGKLISNPFSTSTIQTSCAQRNRLPTSGNP